ncbi:hypothetical protein B0H14DRAFT_3720872 [Mycena olivaceomarginata]|nr:hypothetical protein B0H14DRAFT_3720872 [Mycena olivaceomarginata]
MSARRLLPATDTTSDEWAPPTCALRSVLRCRGGLRICVLLRMGNGREVPGTHHSAARQWLRAYSITLTLTLAANRPTPLPPPRWPQPAQGRCKQEGCMCGIPRGAGALPCTSQWLLYRPHAAPASAGVSQTSRPARCPVPCRAETARAPRGGPVMAATPCVHAQLAADIRARLAVSRAQTHRRPPIASIPALGSMSLSPAPLSNVPCSCCVSLAQADLPTRRLDGGVHPDSPTRASTVASAGLHDLPTQYPWATLGLTTSPTPWRHTRHPAPDSLAPTRRHADRGGDVVAQRCEHLR